MKEVVLPVIQKYRMLLYQEPVLVAKQYLVTAIAVVLPVRHVLVPVILILPLLPKVRRHAKILEKKHLSLLEHIVVVTITVLLVNSILK